jgi:hypothetical protein
MMRSKSTSFALSLCAALVSGIALAAAIDNNGPEGGMQQDMDGLRPGA